MIKRILLVAILPLLALTARADNLSASASEAALAQGALAWDVRASTTGLPGAMHIDSQTLDAWLAQRDLSALEAAVSHAGIDLSRDLVIYGDAGDARAQALVASLRGISRGQVHWLVGGAAEWAMSGRALVPATEHAPVPQHLLAASDKPGRMAAASLRGTPEEEHLALR